MCFVTEVYLLKQRPTRDYVSRLRSPRWALFSFTLSDILFVPGSGYDKLLPMRIQFLYALIIVFLASGTYWYLVSASVCPAPLAYRLGTLDDHFKLTEAAAKEHLKEAEQVWEEAADRDLFYYDENAEFVIDFVFDDRQALADSEASQSALLDAKRSENESFFKQIDELETEYQELSDQYESAVKDYEDRLESYNQTVSGYNDRGGAPETVYEELRQEEAALNEEGVRLSGQADELNDLANNINQLADEANRRVTEYNQLVVSYNRQFGYSREFTQGDYEGDKINIYKFSSTAELVTVLTHEFGHALGIGHVEDEAAVMYYLLKDPSDTPVLSGADKMALIETCGSGDEISHTVRRYIQEVITLLT